MSASDEGEARESAGFHGSFTTEAAFAPARSDGGRVEAESSLWTYVDRAFPNRSGNGAETASVGTGRLAWDRDYTRRALFRFPVALDSDTVVDSAVLRAAVVWSYDCDSDSSVQLHRVGPFHREATWNDQPTALALLDTREVRGGRAACPVAGGVEFDVTEAVQWAVDHDEPHVHLRLAERDESGTTAWRRFDVEDDPPVLLVDHSAPPIPGPDSALTDLPGGPRDGAEAIAPSAGGGSARDRGDPDPSPPGAVEGLAPLGATVRAAEGTADSRVPDPDLAGRAPGGGGHVRSQWGERTDRPTAPGDQRRQDGDADPRARGPPESVRSPVGHRLLRPMDPTRAGRYPSLPMRHPVGWKNASAAARGGRAGRFRTTAVGAVAERSRSGVIAGPATWRGGRQR